MADVQFGDLGNGRDRNDIVEREAVTGMRLDPVLDRERGAIGDALQLGRARVSILWALGMSVAASVELDDRRAEPDCSGDLVFGGFDEQADPDVRRAELIDEI